MYILLYDIYLIFFNNRFLSRWVVLLIDMVLILTSTIVSYSIVQMVYQNLNVRLPEFRWLIVISLITCLICFLLLKTYKGIIRYSTIYEIQRIISSLLVAHFFIFIFVYFALNNVSGSVTLAYCVISLFFSCFALLGLRVCIVFTYNKFSKLSGKKNKKSVFIYGISPESVSLKHMLSVANSKYDVIGFISSDKTSKSNQIADSPIIYVASEDTSELKKYSVKTILFPKEDLINKKKDLINKLVNQGVQIYLMPQVKNMDSIEEPAHKQIRPIQIEDLLGREEIQISMDLIMETVNNKNVLVTGAAGSIGSEIVRQLANFNPNLVICVDIAETPLNDLELELKNLYPHLKFISVIGDVRNTERLSMIFERYQPNIVYHAAAYKHVPMMENNPCEAILTNVYGTKQVADFSVRYNVEMFVMVSTDKAVNPTNVMGASKRIGEMYIQNLAQKKELIDKIKFVTTRFGNVLGSNGSVIPLFRKQIEKGGPLTVTDPNITRYFMTIPEACRLVLEASTIGETGYIYVFDMGEPVKIYDLAYRMIELAGLKPNDDIEIKFTGLRPGEKLYEELLNDSEKVIPTKHEKILIARVSSDCEDIDKKVEELILLSRKVDIPSTIKLMKEIVSEYISNNSRFSEYDNKVVYTK